MDCILIGFVCPREYKLLIISLAFQTSLVAVILICRDASMLPSESIISGFIKLSLGPLALIPSFPFFCTDLLIGAIPGLEFVQQSKNMVLLLVQPKLLDDVVGRKII